LELIEEIRRKKGAKGEGNVLVVWAAQVRRKSKEENKTQTATAFISKPSPPSLFFVLAGKRN